jgi:ribosomal-protein-alanine N-acetyltransferase
MSVERIALPGPRPRLVRFRTMVPADVLAVGAVERASYAYPWSDGIFRDCLRVGYLCRVADLNREIVAYGIAAIGASETHILNLCVRSDLRGRSIGRQMLMLLLERARQAGTADAFLEVRPSNTLAIALYQSVGFIEVGRRRGYYQADGGREDALVLRLRLDDPAPEPTPA